MKNLYNKKIAILMILLTLSIPFYISSVFAQDQVVQIPIQEPASSCIEKHEQASDFVEFLDNDIISTLESIASILFFMCQTWSMVKIVVNLIHLAVGFWFPATPPLCEICQALEFTPAGCPYKFVCMLNSIQHDLQKPSGLIFDKICSLSECVLCNNNIGAWSPANLLADSGASGLQETLGNYQDQFKLSPYDNIYIAMGCMCPVAILFNLRKLKTIYQTYDCCIQEACRNGISTESCEQQLSEATCMFWEGSIFSSLVKIAMSFVASFISGLVFEKSEGIFGDGIGRYVGAGFQLINAYDHLQNLMDAYQWMTRTFAEPTCEDLGFEEIADQRRAEVSSQYCRLVNIDLNDDGIYDTVETQCV